MLFVVKMIVKISYNRQKDAEFLCNKQALHVAELQLTVTAGHDDCSQFIQYA
jgi:hypothetical protein